MPGTRRFLVTRYCRFSSDTCAKNLSPVTELNDRPSSYPAGRVRLMASRWIGLPQFGAVSISVYVALCRPLPGAGSDAAPVHILVSIPQRCTCDDFSFRHTAGLHMMIQAFVDHAPDLTPETQEKLRGTALGSMKRG